MPMKAAGKAGDHQQHRVAEDMAVEHAALGQALGARRHDVLLVDLLEEAVLGQHGQAGEAADTSAVTGNAMCQR